MIDDRLEVILDKYLQDLEEARNVTTKADALIMLKEHLAIMHMYVDYQLKRAAYVDKLTQE